MYAFAFGRIPRAPATPTASEDEMLSMHTGFMRLCTNAPLGYAMVHAIPFSRLQASNYIDVVPQHLGAFNSIYQPIGRLIHVR